MTCIGDVKPHHLLTRQPVFATDLPQARHAGHCIESGGVPGIVVANFIYFTILVLVAASFPSENLLIKAIAWIPPVWAFFRFGAGIILGYKDYKIIKKKY